MNNTNKIIIAILVLVGLIFIGFLIFKNDAQSPSVSLTPQSETTVSPVPPQGTTVSAPQNHEVIYTNEGYIPKEITIKVGDTVTWKNQSSNSVWTASGMHPTHVIYSGTSLAEHCPDTANLAFDQCKADQPGTSWSFTFTKKGTWGYHDHVNASRYGKVIVE